MQNQTVEILYGAQGNQQINMALCAWNQIDNTYFVGMLFSQQSGYCSQSPVWCSLIGNKNKCQLIGVSSHIAIILKC